MPVLDLLHDSVAIVAQGGRDLVDAVRVDDSEEG